jgi:hypothetical protein
MQSPKKLRADRGKVAGPGDANHTASLHEMRIGAQIKAFAAAFSLARFGTVLNIKVTMLRRAQRAA